MSRQKDNLPLNLPYLIPSVAPVYVLTREQQMQALVQRPSIQSHSIAEEPLISISRECSRGFPLSRRETGEMPTHQQKISGQRQPRNLAHDVQNLHCAHFL